MLSSVVRLVPHRQLRLFKLGRSLEKLHEYGCEKLFAELSHKACQKESVETPWSHGDTTSFSFSGVNMLLTKKLQRSKLTMAIRVTIALTWFRLSKRCW